MAPPVPLLAVRGSEGTSVVCGPPQCGTDAAFQRDQRVSRCMTFSKDGTLFGWTNGQNVSVVKTCDGSVLSTFDLPKTCLLQFSPLNNVLVTWQPYTKTQDSPQGDTNLRLWDTRSGQLIRSLFQKKVEEWCPSWSDDEQLAVRIVNNELHFYENNNFDTIANKLHLQKVSSFALSPGAPPYKVAVYVPGIKGAPSFVRLYQYPSLGGPTAALANKSFFKADRVCLQWNQKASCVLVTASCDVDKSGASYYGQQTLHFLSVGGETAIVQLAKNGPIYDVCWSPSSSEFCVVYGFMPAKASIFNLRCEPVFDFGTGPRNSAYYSPQGHLLVLAGFGNLQGQMEVWDVKKYKQVSKPQAADSTFLSWCPDGEHLLTATCSPRLRVSNGYQIFHYTGAVLHRQEVGVGSELWEVQWQPFPAGVFPERPIKYQEAPSELGSTQAPPTQAYRPPALRHLPAAPSTKLHEEEPPQDLRSAAEKNPSKAALKNQRKREAKKAARQEPKPETAAPSNSAPVSSSQSEPSSGNPETDKKIRNVKKKLKAIEELKEQQEAGKVLQKNQLEKLQKEAELLKELSELQVGP
ncbi:eukaryotic translation initiation factor 2A isoform X2 [Gouania willdenowi]|uniref:Eukaryotic translation initiation factor 2A n=1 Tax=Gouania willdenowi TaxID=441366 RepID=A0A8C5E5J4_GOUWI|nr:eukaryotic translation initiation factor 2A isoform X2 [Gouania willdenowi]